MYFLIVIAFTVFYLLIGRGYSIFLCILLLQLSLISSWLEEKRGEKISVEQLENDKIIKLLRFTMQFSMFSCVVLGAVIVLAAIPTPDYIDENPWFDIRLP